MGGFGMATGVREQSGEARQQVLPQPIIVSRGERFIDQRYGPAGLAALDRLGDAYLQHGIERLGRGGSRAAKPCCEEAEREPSPTLQASAQRHRVSTDPRHLTLNSRKNPLSLRGMPQRLRRPPTETTDC